SEESKHTCDCNFPSLRETGSNRADVEFVCKDGRVLQMECSATAVPDENGNFSSFLIIQRDVTGRVLAAAALADSERRFKAIFNSTYQLIGLLDERGTVLEVNQTALDFIGLEQADVVGRPFWEVAWEGMSDSARARARTGIQNAAAGKPVRYEEEVTTGDGSRRIVDFTLKPVFDEDGNTVLIIPEGRDITSSRLAEEEARRHLQEAAHVMRLGTMGEMASSIAHELNQPLAALVSYCGTAKSMAGTIPSSSEPGKLAEVLDRAMEQAHRASDIIRHFREFVSKGDQQRQQVDLDSLVESAHDLLRGELRNTGIMIDLHLDGSSCGVFADRIQIEQVIINLLRNSIDAIVQSGRGDGRIDVYTRVVPNGHVELTVIDNGPGVAGELQEHMFEPFRGNKPSGMGMGLSISRSIVESHGGKLWNNRYQQGGAQFGLTLPECEADNDKEQDCLSH
ncbi:MAG TPA: PAS domain S-box protein, partial [Gammaproteobacteria bacterium]|nr:PAS domain S-box protein [Gammaproteobacteria bacterium]